MTLIPHSFLEEAVGARSWRSLASRLGRGQRDRASRDEVALHVAGETVERDLPFVARKRQEEFNQRPIVREDRAVAHQAPQLVGPGCEEADQPAEPWDARRAKRAAECRIGEARAVSFYLQRQRLFFADEQSASRPHRRVWKRFEECPRDQLVLRF